MLIWELARINCLIAGGPGQSIRLAGVDQDRSDGYAHRLGKRLERHLEKGDMFLVAAIKFCLLQAALAPTPICSREGRQCHCVVALSDGATPAAAAR